MERKNCDHVFHSAKTIKYKVLLHWGDFQKYSPREGEIITDNDKIGGILERIFVQEQKDVIDCKSWGCPSCAAPSVSELDVIEFEDGRRFRILNLGFNELCSKPEDIYCQICSKFYLKREEVPKAVHMDVRNTFYKNGKNNLCEKCFRMWGVK